MFAGGFARCAFGGFDADAAFVFTVDIGGAGKRIHELIGNPARHLYAREGYGDYQLDPDTGHALFWQKRLK